MAARELQGRPSAGRNTDDDDVIEVEQVEQADERIGKSLGGLPRGRGGLPIARARGDDQSIAPLKEKPFMAKRGVAIGVPPFSTRIAGP